MSGVRMQFSNKDGVTGVNGGGHAAFHIPARRLRIVLYMLLSSITTFYGVWMMFDILRANDTTSLEVALLVLFSITFGWISMAFWSGAIGFFLQLFRIDPLNLTKQTSLPEPKPLGNGSPRFAVVMPVYNEDTKRVITGFEASLRSLDATGELKHFDFFLLSDTRNPDLVEAEKGAWQLMTSRLGDLSKHVFYRLREKNTDRKVGNLADFCKRWGSHYEGMIVLDADSVMTGDCMLSLAHALKDNPNVGLVQTVPIPVRQETFFGRFLQFAAVLNSPMLATGLAFWQTDNANYWGHNAIIRIDAFINHCGLPHLSGKAPFGGEILSHDFVEAALLRRAGWDVILLADLEGSYEEVPSNILDYATRDRRWVQGNTQHLGLLRAHKLTLVSRMHFLMGAVAYISSLIWLMMLFLSTIDAVVRATSANEFFTAGHQLFPDWPIAKTGLIVSLLVLTAVMLLLPKVMGLVVTLAHRRQAFGGTAKLLLGTLVETTFAIIIAPIMMLFHAYFVLSVLTGHGVSWNAQPREGRMVAWSEAFQRTRTGTIVALIWGGLTYYFTPVFFWWMTPVLLGLVLAAPIVRYSSSLTLGQKMRDFGIFMIPSETGKDPALENLRYLLKETPDTFATGAPTPALPAESPRHMPEQDFFRFSPPAVLVTD